MKKILPLALYTAILFACNTPATHKDNASPSTNSNDVLTVVNMYNIDAVRAAKNKGDEAASQKIFAKGLNAYVNGKDAAKGIDMFKISICRSPSANAYFALANALLKDAHAEEALKALGIAEQLGYTPLATLMAKYAQAYSYCSMADADLRDSLIVHYMELAIQMGYPHNEDFLKSPDFDGVRTVKNFQTTFDEAAAAGPGSSTPGVLFWLTFRNQFKPLKLPLTINTMWIQSHKLGESVSYEYAKFIPEMRSAEFSRDASPDYYYCGIVTQDSSSTTLLYAGRNSELADASNYSPTFFMLTSFDNSGKIIDKIRAGGQEYFSDTFRVLTIQPNLTFQIRDYKNIYKNDPEQEGYDKNYVVRSEPLGANTYRIGANGKFEKTDAPLAIR